MKRDIDITALDEFDSLIYKSLLTLMPLDFTGEARGCGKLNVCPGQILFLDFFKGLSYTWYPGQRTLEEKLFKSMMWAHPFCVGSAAHTVSGSIVGPASAFPMLTVP